MDDANKLARTILFSPICASTKGEYLRIAKRCASYDIAQIKALKKQTQRVVVAALKRNLSSAVVSATSTESREAATRLIALCDAFPSADQLAKRAESKSLFDVFSEKLESSDKRGFRRDPVRSKKKMLHTLPTEWREKILTHWSHHKSKHLASLCVLSVAGLRPEELSRGVHVRMQNGNVILQIECAKTRSKSREMRAIEIAPDSSKAAALLARAAHFRGEAGLSITCNKNALKLALQRAGRTLFKQVREPLTAYCFRHQFAADQKRAGIGSVSVAAALGHSSDKMQSKYGSALQGAGGAQVLSVECTREPRPERAKQLAKLKSKSLTRGR